MNEEKRPGGLTALAVFNFIFTAFEAIGVLSLIAMRARLIPLGDMPQEKRAPIEFIQNLEMGTFAILLSLSVAATVLLLLSGIGYIKQKRIMGRLLGNVYGILGLVSGGFSAWKLSSELGYGFNLSNLIEFIYPVLTLIFVNTTFKDDLTN